MLLPNHDNIVFGHQAQQKGTHDKHSTPREFTIGETVMARNNKTGMPYVCGKIKKKIGPLTETESGQIWKRHIDHLKSLGGSNFSTSESDEQLTYSTELEDSEVVIEDANASESNAHTDQQSPPRRYPQRESRHPPKRYGQATGN